MRKVSKHNRGWLYIIIIFLAQCVLWLCFVLIVFQENFHLMEEIYSPNGEYVAYIYEGNRGMLSPYSYHLSIKKAGMKLPLHGEGNVFINSEKFTVEWLDNQTLMIHNAAYFRVEDKRNIRKQKKRIKNILIIYDHYFE